jgi:hypothetical protein
LPYTNDVIVKVIPYGPFGGTMWYVSVLPHLRGTPPSKTMVGLCKHLKRH